MRLRQGVISFEGRTLRILILSLSLSLCLSLSLFFFFINFFFRQGDGKMDVRGIKMNIKVSHARSKRLRCKNLIAWWLCSIVRTSRVVVCGQLCNDHSMWDWSFEATAHRSFVMGLIVWILKFILNFYFNILLNTLYGKLVRAWILKIF
jgi:hypothetical protein